MQRHANDARSSANISISNAQDELPVEMNSLPHRHYIVALLSLNVNVTQGGLGTPPVSASSVLSCHLAAVSG